MTFKKQTEAKTMVIVLMGTEVKEIPLKPAEIIFDKDGKKAKYVDSTGTQVKKVQKQASQYVWVFDDGTEYTGKAYKSVKGKPVKEFSKTAVIDKYDEIDKGYERLMIQNDHTYLLVGDKLKSKLKSLNADGKAISFRYIIRGFKVYKAVASYDEELDRCFMRCYRGDISKMDLSETADEKGITSTDDGVSELDLDAMEL